MPDERLCPCCRGIGWLARDVRPGHPQFGQLVRCEVCGAGRQQEHLAALCGLSAEMRDWTFASTRRLPGNAPAYAALQALAEAPAWFVTLTGSYGVGKTRLLAATVNAGRAAGWPAVYVVVPDLLDHLRAAYAPGRELSFDGLWDQVLAARILALDELDRWNPTPWAQEKFFQLVDERYRRGAELLTVCATNAALATLPPYLVSRLSDRRCRAFTLSGPDLRQVRP